MGARGIDFAPEGLARAQRDYEQTDKPVKEIAADLPCSLTTFYAIVKRSNWTQRSVSRPRRRATAEATPPPPDATPAAVVDHLQRTVERELDAIEKILARLPRLGDEGAVQAERAARTLASLTRTLNEVQRLRRAQAAAGITAQTESDDDDDMPRDIDEFRRELARRIDKFVASRTDLPVPDDAA
jgi:hypothetical protein